MTLPDFLKSRKFWLAVVGAAMIVVRQIWANFPLSDTEVSNFVLLIVSLIIGTGLNDVAAASLKARSR